MTTFHCNDFDFTTLEDELRVDQHCRLLLKEFYDWLLARGDSPERASALTYCVDYYLRDYLMDALRCNVLRCKPGLVRCFGGTWHITRTIDPEIALLEQHLDGILAYYAYLLESGLITMQEMAMVEAECFDRDWYRNRIDTFLNLQGDDYDSWEKGCSFRSLMEEVQCI